MCRSRHRRKAVGTITAAQGVATVQKIVTGAGIAVDPAPAVKRIATQAADERVITAPAHGDIIVGTAVERVVAVARRRRRDRGHQDQLAVRAILQP